MKTTTFALSSPLTTEDFLKYLHTVVEGVFVLDHRLLPEVRAMFCAMASRMPAGGIVARYREVVEQVKADCVDQLLDHSQMTSAHTFSFEDAEEKLTKYPIHRRVQKFFDQFVLQYGHGSIMELTGSPSVFFEGLSWYDAWLLFDNPQVAGQEFSTRAVRHKNWPMARSVGGDAELESLHKDWMEVFEAEVEAWRIEFSSPCTYCGGSGCEKCGSSGKKYPTHDKEPFRPALDRARWALPGTIATGCSHTASLRTMARVLNVGSLLAQRGGAEAPLQVWEGIRKGYEAALPGLAGMGLREAIYASSSQLPSHLLIPEVQKGPEVTVTVVSSPSGSMPRNVVPRTEARSYFDATFNKWIQVRLQFQCSLAVARDYHRHRPEYPWDLALVVGYEGILLHSAYEPRSKIGKDRHQELLLRSYQVYRRLQDAGDQLRAMMALPFGTRVQMTGHSGFRDAVYLLELRAFAIGANFEYEAQTKTGLEQLRLQIGGDLRPFVGIL